MVEVVHFLLRVYTISIYITEEIQLAKSNTYVATWPICVPQLNSCEFGGNLLYISQIYVTDT